MNKKILLILANIEIVISTTFFATLGIINGAGDGQVGENLVGWGYLKPFTIDSNILMAVISLVLLCTIFSGKKISKSMTTLYLMGATAAGLTFITVLLFLAPSFALRGEGYFKMFAGDMLFFHLINPLLAIFSVVFLMDGKKIKFGQKLISLLPTFIYAIIYMIHVVIIKDWTDFYGFTFGGKDYLIPFVGVAMHLVTFCVASLISWGHNRFFRRKKLYI